MKTVDNNNNTNFTPVEETPVTSHRAPDLNDHDEDIQEFIRGLIPMSEEAFGSGFLNYWTYNDYLKSPAPIFDAFAAIVKFAVSANDDEEADNLMFDDALLLLRPLVGSYYIQMFLEWLFDQNRDRTTAPTKYNMLECAYFWIDTLLAHVDLSLLETPLEERAPVATPDISRYSKDVQEFIKGLIPMSKEAFNRGNTPYSDYNDYLDTDDPLNHAFAAIVRSARSEGYKPGDCFCLDAPIEYRDALLLLRPLIEAKHDKATIYNPDEGDFLDWLFLNENGAPDPFSEDDRLKCARYWLLALLNRLDFDKYEALRAECRAEEEALKLKRLSNLDAPEEV